MDHTRDNPFKRFTAFWVAFLLVTTFAIGALILRPLTHKKVETAYQVTSEARLAIKNEVLKAEREALNVEALQKALESDAGALASKKPSPGSMAVPVIPPAPAEGAATGGEPQEGEAAPAETTSEPSN